MLLPQPFQYQGSKRSLASLILRYVPAKTTRLVEPFCGSAAVSIAAAARGRAKEFWLNDFNKPLAELLAQMINSPKELANSYEELWRADHEDALEHYYQVRESFNRSPNARLLLYQIGAGEGNRTFVSKDAELPCAMPGNSASTKDAASGTLTAWKKNRPGSAKNSRRSRTERRRKTLVRTQSRRQPGRALAPAHELSPLARLIYALQQEKIRFQVAGMSAAILQGCPATTLDTDLWIDLPPCQCMRVLRLCQKLGATVRADTVVDLSDGSAVNFLYHLDGLLSFAGEYRRSCRLKWLGTTFAVLPLARILRCKRAVGRPQDLAHLPLLEQTINLRKRCGTRT
jgi:hypothetical protein